VVINLYLISQTINCGYGILDSAIVCAASEDEARMIHPGESDDWEGRECAVYPSTWCDAKDVVVEEIGVASSGIPEGIICASYNAC